MKLGGPGMQGMQVCMNLKHKFIKLPDVDQWQIWTIWVFIELTELLVSSYHRFQ